MDYITYLQQVHEHIKITFPHHSDTFHQFIVNCTPQPVPIQYDPPKILLKLKFPKPTSTTSIVKQTDIEPKIQIHQPILPQIIRSSIYWQIRQNPHKCTNQEHMFNMIKQKKIVTAPFAHTTSYKTNALGVQTMNAVAENLIDISTSDWLSNAQDIEFFNVPDGSLCIIPFAGTRHYIVGRIGERTPKKLETGTGMFVNYQIGSTEHDNNDIVNISNVQTSNSEPFLPIYRTFEIIKVIDNYVGDMRNICTQNTLNRLPSTPIRDSLFN